ncbi:MAG: restriction endonuclease subunit S [Bacteroidetes bacterium]|nr:restriction endonuclease subunit S [Bacteroidota bacterium]
MELMKIGYKQTEVGLIPEDWKVSPLSELGEFKNGINKSKEDFGFGYPFVNLMDVFGIPFIIDNSSLELINANQHELNLYNLIEGDVLFVRSSVKPSGVGLTSVVKSNLNDTVFSGFLIRFRFCTEFNLDYKVYCFNQKDFRDRLIAQASVSANTNINQDALKKLQLAYPPTLTEQKAIATALSDVDSLISSLDKLITKKKAIKQGAMQALLKGKKRLKGFGDHSEMKDSEFGPIPADWEVKLLPEVFDYIHGKAHEQFILSDGNYKVVNSKFVSTDGKVVKNSSVNFCPAKKGDILSVLSDLPNGKALAKTFLVEENDVFAVNQRVCIWRTKKDSSLFLNYVMNRNKYFLKLDDGVTQTHILNNHIEKCPVLLPKSIEEQIAIGECLKAMDLEIESLENKKAKYQEIKQGMMQELLTGKTRLV